MWWWSKIALLQREMYRLSEYHLIYTCEVSLLWSFGVCPTILENPYTFICINLHIHIRYMLLNTHTHIPMKREATDMFKGLRCFLKTIGVTRDFWPACVLRQCASHSDIPRRSAVVCRILDQFHGWQRGARRWTLRVMEFMMQLYILANR